MNVFRTNQLLGSWFSHQDAWIKRNSLVLTEGRLHFSYINLLGVNLCHIALKIDVHFTEVKMRCFAIVDQIFRYFVVIYIFNVVLYRQIFADICIRNIPLKGLKHNSCC